MVVFERRVFTEHAAAAHQDGSILATEVAVFTASQEISIDRPLDMASRVHEAVVEVKHAADLVVLVVGTHGAEVGLAVEHVELGTATEAALCAPAGVDEDAAEPDHEKG